MAHHNSYGIHLWVEQNNNNNNKLVIWRKKGVPIIIQPRKPVKLKWSMEKTLKSGGWLTDEHIHLAQEILKDQFPHVDGFQHLSWLKMMVLYRYKAKVSILLVFF